LKFGHMVFKICKQTRTCKQTDRQTNMLIAIHLCILYLEDFVDKFNGRFIGKSLPQSVACNDDKPASTTGSTIADNYISNYCYNYNRFMALWILSGTTRVNQYQKGKTKTNLDFLEQETVSGSGIIGQENPNASGGPVGMLVSSMWENRMMSGFSRMLLTSMWVSRANPDIILPMGEIWTHF